MDISQNAGGRNGSLRENQPAIIAEWELNGRESLRVELHEFKGTKIVGIRKWFPDATGEMRPGKDGINLSLKHLVRLAAAVNDAVALAHNLGLLSQDER